MILLSIFTLARPDSALTGFVVVYGIVAVIMGVADSRTGCTLRCGTA